MSFLASSRILTILIFLLLVFGLVTLASAGVVDGQKKFGSSYYYLEHQILFGALPGLLIFLFIGSMNYGIFKKFALIILIVVSGLTLLVFVPQFGLTIKGAQRWLQLGPVAFQPSEFLKLAMIIYLAAWFSQRQGRRLDNWSASLAPFLTVLVFVGMILVLQPDIKTLSLITVIAISIYFFAGAKIRHILLIFLGFLLIFGLLSFAPYRLNRIKAYLNPNQDTQGVSYHINQAQIAIGSGGIFGLGYGQSRQKFNYLPEPVGDSIFAIIIEELGFVGGAVLLTLFLVLLLAMVGIAKSSKDQFGRLIALGVAVWVTGQALINIAAILNIIPLTGAPLPFVSFGSSSLVAIMAGMGLVVSVGKRS